MKKSQLIVNDEVNVKFIDLPTEYRNFFYKKFKIPIPGARFQPSVRLGRWDGCTPFFNMGGSTYLNLLPEILEHLENKDIDIELVDNRTYLREFEFDLIDQHSFEHRFWPKGHMMAGKPIVPRDYQITAVNEFLSNPQSLQEIATGAGKSLITGILSQRVEKYGRSILIVPSKSLVLQTEEDYLNLGLDVGVFFGDRKEYTKTHTICTWQSLGALFKNTKANNNADFKDQEFIDIEEFLSGVVAVIVDEAHATRAKILFDLLAGPMAKIPIRWGLTGTIPEEDIERIYLKLAIGDVTNSLSASSLQDAGVLSSCDIMIEQLVDFGEYKTYQEELKYLVSNKKRLEFIANKIAEISKSGNTLVLVGRTDTGKQLASMIPNSVFISGATKQIDRKSEFDDIANFNNKVLIATSGIAAVGLNLPRLFNLVFIEIGKSFVRTIQSIGRGLRKSTDKDHVDIYDICSTCKFSKRHLTKRKAFYKKANYKHSVTKVNWTK